MKFLNLNTMTEGLEKDKAYRRGRKRVRLFKKKKKRQELRWPQYSSLKSKPTHWLQEKLGITNPYTIKALPTFTLMLNNSV